MPNDDRKTGRLAAALRRMDAEPRLLDAARRARELLPGDSRYGDPLSTAGTEPPHVIGRQLAEITRERPSVLREVGLSALQVWQGLSEAQGRGRGDQELAILFTDLVDFSTWALNAGDTLAIDLLRDVGLALEPAVAAHSGRVVKRLGDGLMAVFAEPQDAVEAAVEGRAAIAKVEVGGHCPQLRAGIHFGRPRKLGGDYLGVDVNIAARVVGAAGPGEILVSDAARERLDAEKMELRRRWRFNAKGAPQNTKVYSAEPAL
jgi:adenylate cyclase